MANGDNEEGFCECGGNDVDGCVDSKHTPPWEDEYYGRIKCPDYYDEQSWQNNKIKYINIQEMINDENQ